MNDTPVLIANVHRGQTVTHVSVLTLDGDENLEIGKAILVNPGWEPYLQGTVVGHSKDFWYVRID